VFAEGAVGRRALDERAAGRTRFGAHVGERQVKPLGDRLRPGDAGVGDGDDVIRAWER
jgi:hypothetical protein